MRTSWHRLVLLSLSVVGCARGPADVAARLGAADATMSRSLAPSPGAWSLAGGAWQSPGWRSGPGASLLAQAPLAADGALEVGVGGSARRHLSMRLDGARPVRATDDGGRLVYRDAFPSTELLWAGARTRIEAFFLLRDASAPTTFRFTVRLPDGLPRARVTAGGVEFLDENGRASLRVGRAYAVDATGRRRDAALAWADGKLEVRLDPAGLRYPILLDPAIEVANWQKLNDGVPDSTNFGVYDSGGKRILLTEYLSPQLWSWNGSWSRLSVLPFSGQIVDLGGGKLLGTSESGGSSNVLRTWSFDGVAWTQLLVTGPNLGLSNPGPVYDSARGRVVQLVGGPMGTEPFTTWEWDGTKWTQIMIPGPPGRLATAITFDSVRGRTVMFGGWLSGSPGTWLNDTWEYDGVSWTQRCTTAPCKNTVPSVRQSAGMTFDGPRARTVLFGGFGSTSTYGDTWEWDGSVWSQRATTGPGPGEPRLLVYDAALGATVLYGDQNFDECQLWTWNGVSWSLQAPTVPAARSYASVAYDSLRKVTVVFGGAGYGQMKDWGDTWEWNGSSWSLRAASGPPARYAAGTAFDSTRGRVVIHGGNGVSGGLDDTWEWDGSTWTNPSSSGPGARMYAAMTFDSARGRTVLFGGYSSVSNNEVGDTWEWNGSTWSKRATTGPSIRESAAMAFDPVIARSVLVGGWQPVTGALGDTWTWDGSVWTPVTAATVPPRSTHGLAWDTVRKELVLFGGLNNGPLQDTFTGNGSSWTQVGSTFPLPRQDGALVYDQARSEALLFGGGGSPAFSDLWAMKLSGGGCSIDADCEVGHCVDGTCCNVASCGTCQTCNGTAPGTCTPVTNADDADTCTGASTCDASGACKLKAGQSCGSDGTLCASAFCTDGVCCNAGCAQACQVCAVSLGATVDGTCTTAPAGFAGRPSCGAVTCNGAISNCPVNSCNGDAQCATGYFCAGNGTCQPVRSQGMACNSAAAPTGDCLQAGCRECNTPGGCVDGFCCGSTCGLGCQACDQTPGICTVAPAGRSTRCVSYICDGATTMCPTSCTGDAQCATGYHCVSGACAAANGQALGQTCGSDPQCLSGHCVDGKCCDSTCVGACSYCDASGHCQAAAPGTDPRGACAGEPGCSRGCTAAGSCDFPDATTRCDVCTACDGTGRCNQPLADDDACGTIGCAALSTECTQYADVTTMRCVALGVCATANDPSICTSTTPVADGTACSTGVCAGGQCTAAPDGGALFPAGHGQGGCSMLPQPHAAPPPIALLALIAIAASLRRRRRARVLR
jgi:hypothetical protein